MFDRPYTVSSILSSSQPFSSRVRVNLLKDLLHMVALLLGLFPVLRCSLESFRAQTLVHLALGITAHPHRLPHEAFRVAFFESGHDLFAACTVVNRWLRQVRLG